ncbi:MAG TPA: hypothetical protein VNA89_04445 [Gemmatimonadaceae bacterium]|nr:hypothetical protein [Gemmatimonadaceae bacterium]
MTGGARSGRGRSSLGCLLTLLVVVAAGYFALNVGEVYWRYFRYRDGMAQQARFAARKSDVEIVRQLAALADTLGLPDAARDVRVRRTPDRVTIAASYDERIALPGFVRELHFAPRAEGSARD